MKKKKYGVSVLVALVAFGVLLTVGFQPFNYFTLTANKFTARVQLGAGTTVSDTNRFTGTAIFDTVLISGATSSNWYFLTPRQDTSATSLSFIAKADTLIVMRKAAGTSALQYAWLRVTKE